MSEPGMETKVTVVIHPAEMRALMRLGMRLSDGFGYKKTRMCRMAILHFLDFHKERIVHREGETRANT